MTPERLKKLLSQGEGAHSLYYYTGIYSGGHAKPFLTEGDSFTTEIQIHAAAGVIQNVPLNEPNVLVNVPLNNFNVPITDTGVDS
jgi:hypothetical protein